MSKLQEILGTKKRYDYTWRCDCNREGMNISLASAKKEARMHLVGIHPDNCNVQIYIDQYDLKAGELSGTYWVMERIYNSLTGVKIIKH